MRSRIFKVFVLGNHDKCYSYAWWNYAFDMIMCRSLEDLPEKTMLLNEIGVPIYVLEDCRIIG